MGKLFKYRAMKTEVLSFVGKKHLCAVYISHPFFLSGNIHFETLLFFTGAPKALCIMFRDCHNHTGRDWALDWNHRTKPITHVRSTGTLS